MPVQGTCAREGSPVWNRTRPAPISVNERDVRPSGPPGQFNMRRLLTITAAALALSACATAPTRYQPAYGPSGVGFSEQQIEADRFRVSYRGGQGAPEAQVVDYALLRAADLTLGSGYDWFVVDQRYTEAPGGYGGGGPRFSVGVGSGSFGRSSAFGVGLGTSFPIGGATGPALATTLEVRMGRGPKPVGLNAYDAREIKNTVGPRAGYPA